MHSTNKQYQYLSCEIVLVRPMNDHTKKKDHQCTHCEKIFLNKSSLALYLRTRAGKTHIITPIVREILQKCNLQIYMITHSREKPYRCTNCGSVAIRRSIAEVVR